ncbi:UNVERIFIED_CONTAM: hypothetical protein Sradi_4884900 [Sesamum radiatum]|uniref:Zinc knuckle CX2CX4HX4C domain-containing protein n=1 Tax=Sesamum radiatum TaxID=300843 RepID=A0AAW2N1G4_SESRA
MVIAWHIGNRLGKFIDKDHGNNNSWGSTMRIRAELDVCKLLVRCLNLCSPTGESNRLMFSYERLPLFCYVCGILGHIAKCDRQYEAEYSVSSVEIQYGPWPSATVGRLSVQR